MQFDGTPYTPAQQTVRAAIRAARGSMACDNPHCQVITQGGYQGMNSHRKIVHPEDDRGYPGEGTEIS